MDDEDVSCMIFTRNERGIIGQIHTDSEHVARVGALQRIARQALGDNTLDVLYINNEPYYSDDGGSGALFSQDRPKFCELVAIVQLRQTNMCDPGRFLGPVSAACRKRCPCC